MADGAWSFLKNTVRSYLDERVPKKRLRCRKGAVWENAAVRLAKSSRSEAELLFKSQPTDENRRNRNHAANQLKTSVREAVLNFWGNDCQQS